MWYQPPEQVLRMVQTQQAEMRADALEARRTSRSEGPRRPLGPVSGIHLRLGRLLIVVGRTLREDEPPCPDLMRS
jgi:hypothetical protein